MADTISDEAFAQAVSEMGIVSPEHLQAAKAAQARATKQGVKLSLADSMVLKGLLTPAIRQNIEKRILSSPPARGAQPPLRAAPAQPARTKTAQIPAGDMPTMFVPPPDVPDNNIREF